MQSVITRNIRCLYVIKVAKWFSLVMPILYLFYSDNGCSLEDISILKSVYSLVPVILDIPTSYLADSWGRKNCLIVGVLATFLGFLVYSLTASFAMFLVAEIILGIGQSMLSGADSALLYDSLMQEDREEEYLKYEGRVTMTGNISEAIAGVLGGAIAIVSLRYNFYAQCCVAFIGIPAAFMLKELDTKRPISNPISSIWKIIRFSLVDNPRLRYDILFSGVIGAATLTMAWMVLAILGVMFPGGDMKSLDYSNMNTLWTGIIWTALNMIVGIASLYSDYLTKLFGITKAYILILIFITLGYLVTAMLIPYLGEFNNPFAIKMGALCLLSLLFFYIVRGFVTPLLKGYINRQTHPEMRATVLSIRNFVIRIVFSIIFPVAGWICDNYTNDSQTNLSTALYFVAAVIFIPGALFLIAQNRSSHELK